MESWCAAKKCPSSTQGGCQRYIKQHSSGGLPFTACCRLLCTSPNVVHVGVLALTCGGVSEPTAHIIILYMVILYFAGLYMVTGGSYLVKLKSLTFWITTIGNLIFATLTGVFATFLTSPFLALRDVPAVGAMNVAVFSYFFSGFSYSVGVLYEVGPLFALIQTAYPICNAILESPGGEDGHFRDANNMALAMLVMSMIWVFHSASFRILGYRVEWKLNQVPGNNSDRINMSYLLGAGQGHPTWRTPVGQLSSVVLTVLAWLVLNDVRQDLKLQKCGADWVFLFMLWAAPCLITVTVVYILFSTLRTRSIVLPANQSRFSVLITQIFNALECPRETPQRARQGDRPFWHLYKNFSEQKPRRDAYVEGVALHRRGRNTYYVETVEPNRVATRDRVIGCIAWFLATVGILMAAPVVVTLLLVSSAVGRVIEVLFPDEDHFMRCLVQTRPDDKHRDSAAEVLEECYLGSDLIDLPIKSEELKASQRSLLGTALTGNNTRYINLPPLLDDTGHDELHCLLNSPGNLQHRFPRSLPRLPWWGLKT